MRALRISAFALLGAMVSLPAWYLILLGTSLFIPESARDDDTVLRVARWISQAVPPLVVLAFALTKGAREGRPFLFGLAVGLATIGAAFLIGAA